MLIAYLRGLLLPDYPHGLRSIIRENFILQAISREVGADEMIARVHAESGFASLMNPQQANKLLKSHDKMLSLAYRNLNHESNKNIHAAAIDFDSIDKFIEVYKNLAKQGVLTPKQNDDAS